MVVNRGGLLAALVVSGCALGAPGAASATRLEIQFHAPTAGAIELVAVPYQVHFKGQPPPLHPAGLRVSLPRSGPPHSYGLLAGELRTRVRGDTATYVLLIEALRALTSASAAQPLVSVSTNLIPSDKGITGTLHPTAGQLVIDNDEPTEREWKALGDLLAKDGVSNPSAASFQVKSFDDGHAFGRAHWIVQQHDVWNDSWGSLGSSVSGLQVQVPKIERTLHTKFGYRSFPTVTEEPTVVCPATAVVGSPIVLTGTGSPGASLTIIYTTPVASLPITVPLTIGSSGSFTDSIPASVPGTYSFQAASGGGSLGPGATSKTCKTEAEPAG